MMKPHKKIDTSMNKLIVKCDKFYSIEKEKIIEKRNDVRNKLSPESLADTKGISMSALACMDSIEYMPSDKFPELLRIGRLVYAKNKESEQDDFPCYWSLKEQRNILIDNGLSDSANLLLQNIAFRIISSIRPNLIVCKFIDTVGLGDSFAYFTELTEAIKGPKILTEQNEVERALIDVKSSAVNLVQEKLTHKYTSLDEYNDAAGEKLAEPYRVVFVSNFPHGFSNNSIDILLSIIRSSTKTGVSVMMTIDKNEIAKHKGLKEQIYGFESVAVIESDGKFDFNGGEYLNDNFVVSYEDEISVNAKNLLDKINLSALSVINNVVELSDVISDDAQLHDSSLGISIPIGIIGKDKQCQLVMGSEKSGHHALIGGATGTGKTILLHNVICNGARLYPPDELVFFLLDYKEGTEFKVYDKLPHVQVLSIESSRQFGLSALQYLQEEIKRRGKLFKSEVAVSNIAQYRSKTGESLPRILVIIDEFQYLLKGHDKLRTQAAGMLDDISRRGRSFGVHVILSTQSLNEVNLSESTLSNIAIRIAMRMREKDVRSIFSADNISPTTLKVPGEAYLNNLHGQSEGNVRFKTAYIDGEKISSLVSDVCKTYDAVKGDKYIFEGQRYQALSINEFDKIIKKPKTTKNRLYIDIQACSPGYISNKPVGFRLRREYSSNVMITGGASDEVISLSALMLYQVLVHMDETSKVYIADMFPVDTPWHGVLSSLEKVFPNKVVIVSRRELGSVIESIEKQINEVSSSDSVPVSSVVLALLDTQSARLFDSDSGIGGNRHTQMISNIVKNGPGLGFHVFLHATQSSAFTKIFSDKKIITNEFENKFILNGSGGLELMMPGLDVNEHHNSAYFISPYAKYDVDPCVLFEPNSIMEAIETRILGAQS